jgi:ABC-type Fe3+/spermidine/putrescine transport system ATPase subunit
MVTHDQQEALAVSDRVAILNEGRIVDSGTPEALCDQPRDPFAASFMGARTVIAGRTRDGVFEAPGLSCRGAPAGATRIVLRGPRLRLDGASGSQLSVAGRVASRIYVGDYYETDVETGSGRIRVIVPSHTPPPQVGEQCVISAVPGSVSFMFSSGVNACSEA